MSEDIASPVHHRLLGHLIAKLPKLAHEDATDLGFPACRGVDVDEFACEGNRID